MNTLRKLAPVPIHKEIIIFFYHLLNKEIDCQVNFRYDELDMKNEYKPECAIKQKSMQLK